MPVSLKKDETIKLILLEGVVSPEELDSLFEIIRENPDASADLSTCEHLHTGALQLLLMAGVRVAVPPESKFWHNFFQIEGEPVI